MVPRTVYVLIVENDGGISVSVHATPELAQRMIVHLVEEAQGHPLPGDPDERAQVIEDHWPEDGDARCWVEECVVDLGEAES